MKNNMDKNWQKLLQKYKDGNISEEERFMLEKQALDDPFLFDALEGFSMTHKLTDSSNSSATTEKTKTRISTWPRIAAAAVIFVVGVLFMFNSDQPSIVDENQHIAMVLEEDKQNELSEKKTKENQSAVKEPKKKASYIKKEATINESTPLPKIETSQPIKKDQKTKEIEQAKTTTKEKFPTTVYTEHSTPKNIVSEVDPTQNTKTPENDLNGPGENLLVAASEEDSMANLVKPKTETIGQTIYYIVEPMIGHRDFKDYAQTKITTRGLKQSPTKEVIIEFTIDKNGTVKNFLHITEGNETPCPECGAFAISLLQNSGEWKTSPRGHEGRARYTFEF